MLVLFQQRLGLDGNQSGVLRAALTFSIVIGALLDGHLRDRFGRRNVVLITMVMMTTGVSLLVLGGGSPLLLTSSILIGVGSGVDLPVSLTTVS